MANHGRTPFLQSILLFPIIISLLCSSSCFSQAGSLTVSNEGKVDLELYYETLCPYCSRFIVNYLYKIFDNGLIDIVNLKLIPYGNAKINGNGTIKCQVVSIVNSRPRGKIMFSIHKMTKPYVYFLPFLMFFISISPISCKQVSLGLYYETLCPDSVEFIVDNLTKIFENGLIDVVDLHLVPWGNARLQGSNIFKCQHGPDECLLNTVEACAIHVWPDVNEHFPFVYCVEKLVYQGDYIQWGTCFEKLGLDRRPVDQCFASGLGNELELAYAKETNALQPPHRYVPWVTVDGQPLYDDYEDFMSFICKKYEGSCVPKACSENMATGAVIKLKTRSPSSNTVEKIKLMFSRIRSGLRRSWMQQGITAAGLV